jgi:hypothetical protein
MDHSMTRECLLPRLECRTPKSEAGYYCSPGGSTAPCENAFKPLLRLARGKFY